MTGTPFANVENAIYLTTVDSVKREWEPYPDISKHRCIVFFQIQLQLMFLFNCIELMLVVDRKKQG